MGGETSFKGGRGLSGCLNTPRLDSLPWLSVNKDCLSGLARRAEHGENLRPWIGKEKAPSNQIGREAALCKFFLSGGAKASLEWFPQHKMTGVLTLGSHKQGKNRGSRHQPFGW